MVGIVVYHSIGGDILFTTVNKRSVGFGFEKILFGKAHGSFLVLDDLGANAFDFYSAFNSFEFDVDFFSVCFCIGITYGYHRCSRR